MGNKINVNINNLFSLSVDNGITIKELAHDYKKVTGNVIVGAKVENVVVDFDTHIDKDAHIDFFDYTDLAGNKMYQAGLKFIMIIAARELWGKTVSFKYSIDKGIYAEFDKKISAKTSTTFASRWTR